MCLDAVDHEDGVGVQGGLREVDGHLGVTDRDGPDLGGVHPRVHRHPQRPLVDAQVREDGALALGGGATVTLHRGDHHRFEVAVAERVDDRGDDRVDGVDAPTPRADCDRVSRGEVFEGQVSHRLAGASGGVGQRFDRWLVGDARERGERQGVDQPLEGRTVRELHARPSVAAGFSLPTALCEHLSWGLAPSGPCAITPIARPTGHPTATWPSPTSAPASWRATSGETSSAWRPTRG